MIFSGNPVSQGVVMGKVMRYAPYAPALTAEPVEKERVQEALAAYERAREKAQAELDQMEAVLQGRDPEKAKIMAAHRDILLDPAMDEEVRGLVTGGLVSPDSAVAQVYDTYAEVLGASKNKMMRERASDLRDVKGRFLRCWAGVPEQSLSALPGPVIVVADDLYPSDTISLDRENVLGIITQVGGSTSHTAIIARSYEIPAVLGVSGIMERLRDGETVILDAGEGTVITDPSAEETARYAQKANEVALRLKETKAFLDATAETKDGCHVDILLNVAAAGSEDISAAVHADGCGLFRTEFLYLKEDHLPDEEEQFQAYKRVLEAFGEKPVTLRTMDIGGDKCTAALAMPKESNPFLGVRGLRLSLERMELFRIQIRAALRASVYGKLKIMFPMVGALDEVRCAKEVIAQEGARLDSQGTAWDHAVEIGIMVEVPSIALIADLAVDEVDFVSVGTNDLTQYLCAADRMNPAVEQYYQSYHPAVFRLIGQIVSTFRAKGKSVSVCGELGGDPLAIPVLVGLGIRKLSMGAAAIPAAKQVTRGMELRQAELLAEEVQGMRTEAEIRARLKEFAGQE